MKTRTLKLIKAVTLGLALYTCLTSLQAVAQGTRKLGPGDSGGGGTGIANSVYEKYRFNPLETEAFKKHLKPTFDRLDQEAMSEYLQRKATHEASSQTPFNENEPKPSSFIFKLRNWYLVPGKLKALSSQSLGVAMLTKSSETYAFQDFRELWVSKDYFDQKSTEDQAKLLLHEMIVSLYLWKYQPMIDILKRFDAMDPQARKSSQSAEPNTTYYYIDLEDLSLAEEWSKAPLEFKGLTKDDYANIREVTYWFWTNRAQLTSESFNQICRLNNFDKRFFRNDKKQNSSSLKEIKVEYSGAELFQKVQEGILTQSMDSKCFDPGLKEIKDCHAQFTANQIGIKLGSQELLVNLSIFKDYSEGRSIYSFPATISSIPIDVYRLPSQSPGKIGDITWRANAEIELIEQNEGAQLGELVSITLQAYVITRKENSTCFGKSMKQVNGSPARILFLANNLKSEFIKSISAREILLKDHLSRDETPFYCPEK